MIVRQAVGGSVLTEAASIGGELIVVEYTLENRTNRPLAAFRLPNIVLIDPSGVVYKPDIGKSGAYTLEGKFDRKLVSDLNPGIQVRDAEVFEISRRAFDRETWQIGMEGSDGPRISLRDSTKAKLASQDTDYKSDVSIEPRDCGAVAPPSERVLCESPDLLRWNDKVGKRLLTFVNRHPDDPRMQQLTEGVRDLQRRCSTRDCVARWTSKWEQIANQWGAPIL
jgi:hypothetical protein